MSEAKQNNPIEETPSEYPEYLSEQIITYIGNKRALLSFIGDAIDLIRAKLCKEKLVLFDVFSGSGIVARYFKQYASRLYANDLEAYSCLCNSCYLSNRCDVNLPELGETLAVLKQSIHENLHGGFITELYSPKNDLDIQPGERVFYTARNAQFIDTARQAIAQLPQDIQKYFLAPLIYGASVHTNTSGVFKGFYKNKSGIGQFGGHGKNALTRILGEIDLMLPVLSRFECDFKVFQEDALQAAADMPEDVDLAYLDPPYNQHPYGSNYFMLNLILNYQRPGAISSVSGIPTNWNHSAFNLKQNASEALFKLVENLRAKYILISYNSEGFVKFDDFIRHLTALGDLTTMSTNYNAFRGSRNLSERDIHVKEYLFLLKKS